MAHERERVPVLVVGGGTVGLSAALLLAQQGIPALLVERRAGISNHPRATGLGLRSVEIFRQAGVEPAIVAASTAARVGPRGRFRVANLAELAVAESHLATQAGQDQLAEAEAASPCRMGLCAQDVLDPVLMDAALERGARIRFGHELVSLEQDEEGVTARVRDLQADVDLEIRADVVIAADGTRSRVRQQAGIGTDGPGALGAPLVNILFRADLAPHLGGKALALCELTRPEAPGLLVATSAPDRWLCHVPDEPTRDREEPPAGEWCVDKIRRVLGLEGLEVEVLSALPWQINARLAQRFQQGRVFLAGDAAHTVPPLGAFGMNTGIADAHNLAWKIAAVLQGRAGRGLLESYDEERRAVAAFTLSQAMLRLKDPDLHWDPSKIAERARAGAASAMVVHLGYRYASRAIACPVPDLPSLEELERDLDGAPGSRLPHAWLARRGERCSTLDLVRGRFTLLLGRDAQASQAWQQGADAASARTALPLDVHLLGEEGELLDPEGAFAARVGIGKEGALLVRPDQFIAWRSPTGPEEHGMQLAQILEVLLARGARVTDVPRGNRHFA
ncbi:FAD-dependent oxidoreductase [Sorangium sp. So ce1182]|uniref:FAD-dependent oxidoreductase n=1 Tax=Sorangium sp. So ce1182 TaxID=3133334 RepID=UPI003F5F86DE